MAKKEKIEIHRDEALTDIDDEFDRALGRLSGAEQNVRDLLETIEGENAPEDEQGEPTAEHGVPASEPESDPEGAPVPAAEQAAE
jgi:hypothetical protein